MYQSLTAAVSAPTQRPSLSPLGSKSSHCATPIPCRPLPHSTKTPFLTLGAHLSYFCSSSLCWSATTAPPPPRASCVILVSLGPSHPTLVPSPHSALALPVGLPALYTPTLRLMPLLPRPTWSLSDGEKEELIPHGLWRLPGPRAWLLDQLGLFVACCRNQLGNISKNNDHN